MKMLVIAYDLVGMYLYDFLSGLLQCDCSGNDLYRTTSDPDTSSFFILFNVDSTFPAHGRPLRSNIRLFRSSTNLHQPFSYTSIEGSSHRIFHETVCFEKGSKFEVGGRFLEAGIGYFFWSCSI